MFALNGLSIDFTFITIATETDNSVGIDHRPIDRLIVDIRDLSQG